MTHIVFRTDASERIGTGHLMRCLALGDALTERGATCHFIGRISKDLQKLVTTPGHRLHVFGDIDRTFSEDVIDVTHDSADTRAYIAQLVERPRWLVTDHYGIDARWESALRSAADHIMSIDDLDDRAHDCDILLDQNLAVDNRARYSAHVTSASRTLLGPRFALLRREVRAARLRRRVHDGRVHRILVCFGGSDPTDETSRVLRALSTLAFNDLDVVVIAGAANPHAQSIERLCAGQQTRCRYIHQTEDMAGEMSKADLAIGAGGVMALERCAAALPALVWPVSDNQRAGIDALAQAGAVIAPLAEAMRDECAIAQQLAALVANPSLLRVTAQRAAEVCDGRGADRVASLLIPPEIHVRRAVLADAEWMLLWRNHPDIRRYALEASPIDGRTHREWLARTVADQNRVLLIAEDSSGPLAVVRYDIENTCAEVSIYLSPQMIGRGLGYAVLATAEHWLRDVRSDVNLLTARVRPENITSARLFRDAGYTCRYELYRKSLHD
jgi:UDP-2,4-diacetamido-2,4,6-trideoxy-beta-L-altropyranose hydrolase